MSLRELETRGVHFYDVRAQLRDHIYGRSRQAFAAGERAKDALRSAEDVRQRQAYIRKAFLDGLGGLPDEPVPAVPPAKITGSIAGEDFDIEKIIFQSRPGVYVTANLYLPHGRKGPTAAVLFLCGHDPRAKEYDPYQVVVQILARAGLIVLAMDPIGQGERYSYYEPLLGKAAVEPCTLDHDYAGAQVNLVGGTLGRYFVHDAMRGVDYLVRRPEVDARRIGVTGSSGGGTQTSMLMLCEPRIAAAAPATFITNRQSYQLCGQSQDAEQIWPNFTGAGLDHEDIVLAMAPRPVCVLAVRGDFFPIEGTRRTVQRAARIYEMLGAAANLELFEDDGRHRYSPAMARHAARFFGRHLLGREVDADRLDGQPLPPGRLWCTASGQVRGEVAGASTPFEENRRRLELLESSRNSQAAPARFADAVRWLRQQVVRDRQAVGGVLKLYAEPELHDGLLVEAGLWWTQAEMFGHGLLFRDPARTGQALPLTLAVWDDGTSNCASHSQWLYATTAAGRAVLVLDVSGVGRLRPHPTTTTPHAATYGTEHKLADDLTFLGDSLAALRTWDVLQCVAAARQWPGVSLDDLHLYAHGRQGWYGRLAAVLEPAIRRVDVAGPVDRMGDLVRQRYYNAQEIKGIILRGVLQYFDCDDLESMRAVP